MCRHLAYLGPPIALDTLLFRAPHSLGRQARGPRHQLWGDDNPDGWGVAWYEHPGDAPRRHRTVTPIWDDVDFAARAPSLCSGAFVAAARLASPGAALVETGNAPFVEGRWACSLNGIVDDFPGSVGDELRALMTPERRAALVGDADTEVLFSLVLQHLDEGRSPVDALATVVHDVLTRTTGRLNFLLTDGERLYATRVGNSLFHRGAVIVSEPTDDDDDWREIPDHTAVALGPDGVVDTAL